jgi:hypothetical protein
MLREIKCPQRLPRQLHLACAISAGVASLSEGKFDCTVSRTAKGKVTVTFNEPFARAPIAVGLLLLYKFVCTMQQVPTRMLTSTLLFKVGMQ